ncbi:hypothetical protein Tco_1321562 [Tanacetum coccineum]
MADTSKIGPNVTSTHRGDALDSAAGGNFLDKMPQESLAIIESKSKVRYSRSRASDSRRSLEDKMTIKMKQNVNEMKALVVTTPAPVKAVEEFFYKQYPSNPRNDKSQALQLRSGASYNGPPIPRRWWEKEVRYGYVKYCKKTVKNGQKRTRERMSDQEAKEIKSRSQRDHASAFYSQLQLTHSQPKPTPLFYKHKG